MFWKMGREKDPFGWGRDQWGILGTWQPGQPRELFLYCVNFGGSQGFWTQEWYARIQDDSQFVSERQRLEGREQFYQVQFYQ